MDIRFADFENPQVQALIQDHLRGMHDSSPPGSVFALDLSQLKVPHVHLFTAWQGDQLMGMGALSQLNSKQGEIKSMRTHPAHVRKGVAAALLQYIMEQAKALGLVKLSLETGRGPDFEPALALYRRFGFTEGPAFADYPCSNFSTYMHCQLA